MLLVQKFGGSSLADPDAIRRVAKVVVEARRGGSRVVAVVSAMGDTTRSLLDLAREMAAKPDARDLDLLLSSGELVSACLLSMAVAELGEPVVALTGAQCGVITNPVHGNARILAVRPGRIEQELEAGRIVIATGFQGVSEEGEVTTIGRDGSDTSAVALALALEADSCEIFTDVAGVFSADPRQVPNARLLDEIDAAEMQEMAWQGAQVMKAEAVELARAHGKSITVRSSAGTPGSTRIVGNRDEEAEFVPRRLPVAGVAGRQDLLRLELERDRIDGATEVALFELVAPYDLAFASLSGVGPIEIYLSTEEIPDLKEFARRLERVCGSRLRAFDRLGAVSLVGFGLGSRPASLYEAWSFLHREGLEPIDTWTGREFLTYVLPQEQVARGVELLHRLYVETCAEVTASEEGRQDPSGALV